MFLLFSRAKKITFLCSTFPHKQQHIECCILFGLTQLLMHWSVSFIVSDAQLCFITLSNVHVVALMYYLRLVIATRCRTSCHTHCRTSQRTSRRTSLALPFDVPPCTKCDSPFWCTSSVLAAPRYPSPQFTLAGYPIGSILSKSLVPLLSILIRLWFSAKSRSSIIHLSCSPVTTSLTF